jgi:hypothetical protein
VNYYRLSDISVPTLPHVSLQNPDEILNEFARDKVKEIKFFHVTVFQYIITVLLLLLDYLLKYL